MQNKIGELFSRLSGGQPPKAAEAEFPPDFSAEDIATWRAVSPYTMTSKERVFGLCNAVRYVVDARLPGDIVECGVWRGGSMMAVARTLLEAKDTSRTLHLFDTYEGMPPPTDRDVDHSGVSARAALHDAQKTDHVWAIASFQDVERAIHSVGYEPTKIRMVQGRVEDTIPREAPAQIALLRLDPDWYESTRHELIHLFPRLCPGGVIILDDYGHWQGARKATDEYFAEKGLKVLLNRIDYTGRIGIKPASAA